MFILKQSTAITVPFFAHDVNGDGVTGMADGGFTKRISKNGGAFAAMTVTVTEMENGWYSIPLSTTHSDTVGLLTLSFSNASCKRVNLQFRISARIQDDLMQTYTQPTGFLAATFPTGTIANTTNITAGTIATVTTLTNLPAITANWLTAAGINASALNGKGDWNINKTGYTLTATTGLGNQTANITGTLSGAVGSVTGAVGSVTGMTASDVGAIKTTTDKFIFTVANQVDANVQYVNDILVTGNGQPGTEWGP